MTTSKQHQNYKAIIALIGAPPANYKRPNGFKLTAPGYMDLSVDFLIQGATELIALAHYGEQNGDLMADPDMEIYLNHAEQRAIPVTYTNHYVGVARMRNEPHDVYCPNYDGFLSEWLTNIAAQGHKREQVEA